MADDPAAQQLQQALAQINTLQQQLQAMQQQLNNQPAQQGQDAAEILDEITTNEQDFAINVCTLLSDMGIFLQAYDLVQFPAEVATNPL